MEVNAKCRLTGYTPLHEALLGGNNEIVKLLMDHGASIAIQDDIDGNTALHLACSQNNVSVVRIMLENREAKKCLILVNAKGQTPRQLCTSKFVRTIVEGIVLLY